jgi:hypothetical protein
MSMTLWEPQSVSVSRVAASDVQDPGGGFGPGTPLSVFSGVADVIICRGVNESRDESDPGISTRKIRQFEFLRPISFLGGATKFRPQDQVVWADETYTVQFVWEYDDFALVEAWVFQ